MKHRLPEMLLFFQYLSLHARFKEVEVDGIVKQRGILYATFDEISRECGISSKSLKSMANRLKAAKYLHFHSSPEYTVFYLQFSNQVKKRLELRYNH